METGTETGGEEKRRDDMALVKILEKSKIHYGSSDISMTVQCRISVRI